MYVSICMFVRLLVCVVNCPSVLFRYLTQTGWRRCARPTDMEFKAIHLTTGHLVSVNSFARSLARSLARPLVRQSAHPSSSPARANSHQTDRCRILSVLMARSQKAFHTIHLTQAMWYPLPHPSERLLGNGRRTPCSNPLTR